MLLTFLCCKGIDSTASFFGDPHLGYKSIRRVVDAVFDEEDEELIDHDGESLACEVQLFQIVGHISNCIILMLYQYSIVCIKKLVVNPYIKRFLSGRGRSRVKFKDNLVEEFQHKMSIQDQTYWAPPSVPSPSPTTLMSQLLETASWASYTLDGVESPKFLQFIPSTGQPKSFDQKRIKPR